MSKWLFISVTVVLVALFGTVIYLLVNRRKM